MPDPAKRMWSNYASSLETPDGRKRIIKVRETYTVPTTTSDDLDSIYLTTPDLPQVGDIHPDTTNVIAKKVKPRQIGPLYWHVDVEWEGEVGPGGKQDSPLNDPPEISWGKVDSQEPIDEDLNGAAIATVNGEPIAGVTKDLSDLVVTIKKNYAAVDLASTHQYLHSVNSDTFLDFAAGTGKMTGFNAKEKIADNVPGGQYFEVTATVQFRYPYQTTAARAWWKRVRHEGYRVKDANGDIGIGRTDKGEMISSPVLLKADGTEETTSANAHFLEFQIYQPLSYGALGLTS